MSSVINVVRLATMGTVCFFALIVLGVSAHIIFVTSQAAVVWDFTALGVAVSALTLLTFPPLLIISLIRKGALPNYIAVEVGVMSVFWVLWLAAASLSADQTFLLPTNCDFSIFVNGYSASCHEPQALQAFSWLNWLILTGYVPLLIALAIIQQTRGNSVWTKSVNEVNLFAPRAVPVGGMYPPQQQPMVYAPQPMQQQPQMGYPPNTPQATYVPSPPLQGGYAATPPPVGYTPTPPQQPQQYAPAGAGYPQV